MLSKSLWQGQSQRERAHLLVSVQISNCSCISYGNTFFFFFCHNPWEEQFFGMTVLIMTPDRVLVGLQLKQSANINYQTDANWVLTWHQMKGGLCIEGQILTPSDWALCGAFSKGILEETSLPLSVPAAREPHHSSMWDFGECTWRPTSEAHPSPSPLITHAVTSGSANGKDMAPQSMELLAQPTYDF